jgi:hypothetical protein
VTKTDPAIRSEIVEALCAGLEPLPEVLAGWEGGSAAWGTSDEYSDLDLNFLVADDAPFEALYSCAERSLETVSRIALRHSVPPGRYYRLKDGGEFLLLDLCFFHQGAAEHNLEFERHGQVRQLFDKADWLRPRSVDEHALSLKRQQRREELSSWFPVSQSFVRKAILRGKRAEAMAAFWGYTLRPLAEILRMRYCPVRWDFGMRYLDRDLPTPIHDRFCDLLFVQNLEDLEHKLNEAAAWGGDLLDELSAALAAADRARLADHSAT